ncbi:DUF4183 domain-containing protein [Brevibacillus nitrificans]|uniref:DUF4183 domain-containing protein n=1 Tax=Brevibacillus nitrificans TaxID=651560 RepID=UPI00286531CC|nr:DUF4183 domain-containing protein [Brevibacillus nitrificans]MDR7315093.1 hypothetical protein [Brevibacillus nitrificans]
MALEIMKIVVGATTVTNVVPTAIRLFYQVPALTTGPTTLSIDAADFLQDDGNAATTLPTLDANNSYYNVFINGVLQMSGLSVYTPGATGVGSLAITVPTGESISENTVVVLEIVSYAPTSTTTVTG